MMKKEKVETPPSAARWTGFLLHWVDTRIRDLYFSAMSDLQVSPAQIAVLQYLKTDGPATQSKLSLTLRIDKGALSKELDNLQARSFVSRQPMNHDRRSISVQLRVPGERCLEEIERRHGILSAHVFASLTAEQREKLHELLTIVAEGL